MEYTFMITAGLLTGIMSGVFGIGGGVILIPILVLLLGFKQQTANGTSLVALLLPVGILGVVQYYKSGTITFEHIRDGLVIAVGIFFGTYVGAKFATSIPDFLLRKGFALLLAALSARMWFIRA